MENRQLLEQITVVIKTFERPKCLDRLIASIKRYYPSLPILVADDSLRPYPRPDVQYLRLPADVGLSAGRNALLARVETPLFLLLDDDYEFTGETQIERLAVIVARGQAELAAGCCIWSKPKLFRVKRKRSDWCGVLHVEGDHLTVTSGHRRQLDGFVLCDIVNNFFVASTEAIRSIGGWDDELKLNEHEEFFLRLHAAGLRTAYCRDVSIIHWHARPRRYSRYRNRDFRSLALAKHGICRLTEMNGRTVVFEAA